MKNLVKSAGLLFVALGALCVTSCSPKDDLVVDGGKAKATEFASASIQLQAEKASNPTGKTVERGTLHAWIKDVNITVTSLDWAYAAFMTPFELVANTNNQTNNINYVIDNVALGMNQFDVITTTSTVPSLTFLPSAAATAQADYDLMKAKNPYAIYKCNFQASVNNSGQLTPNYAQTLLTDHGRGIGMFSLSADLIALGGTAVVTVVPSVITPGLSPVTVTGTTNGSFYFSNDSSKGSEVVTFSVQIKNANGSNYGTPFTTTLNLIKSTSVNNKYIINKSGIIVNHTMEQFVAEPWHNADGTVIIN